MGLISAATLTFEILLVRLYAIETFHHFATMAIGVAMLGVGAAGTLVATSRAAGPDGTLRRMRGAAVLAAAALLIAPAAAQRVALDPTQLAWSAGAWPRLALVYVLLALPFLFGGLVTLLALVRAGPRPGTIYGASFAGSGLGALAAFAVLGAVTPDRAMALPALLAAAAATLTTGGRAARPGATTMRRASWTLGVAAVAVAFHPICTLRLSPYKALAQFEAHPGAYRLAARTGPLGWVVTVASPALRHAPGLSLAFEDAVPVADALCVDGDMRGSVTDWSRVRDPAPFFGALPSSLPFALGMPERVLVPGAAGGLEAPAAIALGAREVVATEPDPNVVALSATRSPAPARGGARLAWRSGPARGLARADTAGFDLVSIGVDGGLGASAGGLHALDEDYVHTVEGYAAWLACLRPGGVLAVTRWLEVPPRSAPRAILTAAEALRRTGVEPGSALVVVRGWSTATVLVRPSGFDARDLQRIGDWCQTRGFTLERAAGEDVATGAAAAEEAGLRAALRAALEASSAARYAREGPFDLRPACDARPFARHYVRLDRIPALLGADRGAALPFAEWGPVALVATLIQSGLVALTLLALPLARRGPRDRSRRAGETARVIAYFAAIGIGYMGAEIAALHQLGLLLGHPVRAVTVTLVTLLVASGIGSIASDRIQPRHARPGIAVLAAVLVAIAVTATSVAGALVAFPLATRVEFAVVPLAVAGFLMGLPFPCGLRRLAGSDARRIAWAWAANGFASVVAVPLAALAALESGVPAVGVGAAGCYVVAAVLLGPARAEGGPAIMPDP